MSTPSAHRQTSRAQERAAESLKAQLDTLETKYRADMDVLTERLRRAETEAQGLSDSNKRLIKDNDDYRNRIKELEVFRISTEQRMDLLQAQVNYEAGRLDVAEADLELVAPGLTIKTFEDGPVELGAEIDGQSSIPVATGPGADVIAQSQVAAGKSLLAHNSSKLKEAVRAVLFGLYRVKNFNNIADKHYPHVPIDHKEWPHSLKPDGTRENYMRLDFEEDFDSPTNRLQVDRWVDAIRNQGEAQVAGVQPFLDVISEADLLGRVEKTFNWEQRTYKNAMKNTPIPTKNRTELGVLIPPVPIVESNPAPLTEVEIAARSIELATMSTATWQSHQETKRDTRMRKRPLLENSNNSQYLEAQYNSVLNLGAQSEDDYEVESVNGHEPRRTGRLIAREWSFASPALIACKAAIDAIPDPRPATGKRPTPLVCGNPRPGAPRRNKKVEHKMYRWMISKDELQSHPEWLSNGRVVENDGSLSKTATVLLTKRKASKGSHGLADGPVAGPSDRGKRARLTLQVREKALKEELGDLKYEDLLDEA